MRFVIVGIIISLCVFATVTQSQTSSAQNVRPHESLQVSNAAGNHELSVKAGEKDFLLPGEGFANRKGKTVYANAKKSSATNIVISRDFPAESIVEYKSFTFGTTFTLHSFSGKYVSYLMSESLIGSDGLTRDEIRELVDLTDLLYAHMAEIVGGEPSGDGLLTIALLNPGRDFGGRGWVGSKGVEMFPTYLINNKKSLSTGCLPNIVIHELSHNFDLYNAYISHDGDNAHAWTAFLIPYVEYYSRAGVYWNGLVVDPSELLDHTTTSYTRPWDTAAEGFDWDNCVKNGNGCWDQDIYANETWAGVLLRFARLHGTSTTRRVFSFLKDYRLSHPIPPVGAVAKNDLLVVALATAANSNIQCELGAWKWPASLETIEEIKQRFPGQNSFCTDLDGDGYTPLQNDHDDFNRVVNPAARETVNGIDDDCDGIVDDIVINEDTDFSNTMSNASLLPLPSHVIGRMSNKDDRDTFQLEINSPRSLNIWATGIGQEFSGWLEIRYASDPDSSAPIYVWSDYPGGSVVAFDRPGTWILTVVAWSDVHPGYEIFLSEIQFAPFPQLRIMPISKSSFLIANITSDQNELKQSPPTDVRIWAEGVGFIAQQPFQPVTVFKLRAYGINANARLRAQFLTNNSPTSSVTVAVASKSASINVLPYQPVKVLSAPIAVSPNANAAPNSERRLNRKLVLLNE
jgi:hypothetical protein